jgi:YARHG domain
MSVARATNASLGTELLHQDHAPIDRRSGPVQGRRFKYASALHCCDHANGCRNPGEHRLVISGASVALQFVVEERNSYYKEAGYCFHTARAIRRFGNAGCRFDDEAAVPLSRANRNRIAQIVREERRLGCSD